MRKILQVTKWQGWEVFMVLIFLTGLTEFTGLRLVGGLVRVWSSSSRVELGDFAKVARRGLVVPKFWVGVVDLSRI